MTSTKNAMVSIPIRFNYNFLKIAPTKKKNLVSIPIRFNYNGLMKH